MQELTLVNEELAVPCINNHGDDVAPSRHSEAAWHGEGQKMKSSPSSAHNRRHFLRALGGASAATLTVAVAPAPVAEAYDPGSEETRARYRETEDVKAFYRTNRYEGTKK
jgi:hypothetical protein